MLFCGVDSSFLLQAAKNVLGTRFKAVTIDAPYIPHREIGKALALVKEIKVDHEIIVISIIARIHQNPLDRCYHCKRAIFSVIQRRAIAKRYSFVVDAINLDDMAAEYRSGRKILEELHVKKSVAYLWSEKK